MSKPFKMIDLFAGAGGLSLGFMQTNQFEIKAAIEKNPNAQNTYRHNFPGVDLYDDITGVDFRSFNDRYGQIDVVIGGPPCQGFSNANRQHNQAINLNNKLVKQYIRAIQQIQPKAFVMENVGMLKSNVHRFYIERDDEKYVDLYNIPITDDRIFLLDGKWTFEGVLDILENEKAIKNNMWPEKLFKDFNIVYKNRHNLAKMQKAIEKYATSIEKILFNLKEPENEHIRNISKKLFQVVEENNGTITVEELLPLLEEPLAIQKMLIHAEEIYSNNIEEKFGINEKNVVANVKSCAVYDYLTSILGAESNESYAIENGILSAVEFGIPQKRRRFVIIGVKKKYSGKVEMPKPSKKTVMTNVYNAIADLENVPVRYSVEEDDKSDGSYIPMNCIANVDTLKSLRNKNGKVYNHVVPRTREIALRRFQVIKPGENFHSLSKEMKENTYTNAERTQNTVYLRLNYNEPSGTVINVRKSMWIHPELDRAVSIREAARLQTFPDSFRFYGPKDSEYQQVGNAVPPMLAQIIAEHILSYIDKLESK